MKRCPRDPNKGYYFSFGEKFLSIRERSSKWDKIFIEFFCSHGPFVLRTREWEVKTFLEYLFLCPEDEPAPAVKVQWRHIGAGLNLAQGIGTTSSVSLNLPRRCRASKDPVKRRHSAAILLSRASANGVIVGQLPRRDPLCVKGWMFTSFTPSEILLCSGQTFGVKY